MMYSIYMVGIPIAFIIFGLLVRFWPAQFDMDDVNAMYALYSFIWPVLIVLIIVGLILEAVWYVASGTSFF